MTELLTALVAASRVGFDAPGCQFCSGYGVDPETGHDPYPCSACHATGLDASDPERLIGRAMMVLHLVEPQFKRHGMFGGPVVHIGDPECPATVSGYYDGTPASLATAMLRLVARTGGAA